MAVENWKFWLIPFGAWGMAVAWYSGYQLGYQEGHQTASLAATPSFMVSEFETTRTASAATESKTQGND